jgi:GTP-binding protein
MKFEAVFVASFPSVDKLPNDGRAEVALIGRSNVGKSSLINALADRRQLAKTSATPGKTRLLNYYLVNGEFYLVDMPGYGFAKQAKSERFEWALVAEKYFLGREPLRGVGVLIDGRHIGIESDLMAVRWFVETERPFFVVMTKCDKVKQSETAEHKKFLKTMFPQCLGTFAISSTKGNGIPQLRKFIVDLAISRNFEAG